MGSEILPDLNGPIESQTKRTKVGNVKLLPNSRYFWLKCTVSENDFPHYFGAGTMVGLLAKWQRQFDAPTICTALSVNQHAKRHNSNGAAAGHTPKLAAVHKKIIKKVEGFWDKRKS